MIRSGTSRAAGRTTRSTWALFLEFFLVISNVGTAVVLYPIARRQNEALAIGYVAARIIESVFIASGIIFVLGVVGLRHDFPARTTLPSRSPRSRTGRSCSAPESFPLGNGLILGYLMYRSGLVPRRMAWLGLIGGPLLFFASVGALVRLVGRWQHSAEPPGHPRVHLGAFLGIYCAIWGFRKDSPIVRPNWRGNATAA